MNIRRVLRRKFLSIAIPLAIIAMSPFTFVLGVIVGALAQPATQDPGLTYSLLYGFCFVGVTFMVGLAWLIVAGWKLRFDIMSGRLFREFMAK